MVHKKLVDYSQHFFIFSLLGITLLTFLLIKPFITYILAGLILSYMLHPLNKKLKKVVINDTLAAVLMILFVLLIVLLPIFFVGNKLLEESFILFKELQGADFGFASDKLSNYFGVNIDANLLIKTISNKFVSFIASIAPGYIATIPQKIIGIFIMLFIMFYLFKEGTTVLHSIGNKLPIKTEYKNRIKEKINRIVFGFFDGLVIISLIQGILSYIGFKIFGIPSPLVWAIVTAVLTFIPALGAPLVYVPLVFIALLSGNTFSGIGLLLYGIIFISGIENFLKPILLGEQLGLHPILMMLGMFGGISLFGLFGIIIGPIVIAIFMVFFEIYTGR